MKKNSFKKVFIVSLLALMAPGVLASNPERSSLSDMFSILSEVDRRIADAEILGLKKKKLLKKHEALINQRNFPAQLVLQEFESKKSDSDENLRNQLIAAWAGGIPPRFCNQTLKSLDDSIEEKEYQIKEFERQEGALIVGSDFDAKYMMERAMDLFKNIGNPAMVEKAFSEYNESDLKRELDKLT